jgi:hypothetical protein
MQKICIAIVLALAMTCVVADYTVTAAGWVKAPVVICADNETACNNQTNVNLLGLTSSDVNLAAYAGPTIPDSKNESASSWSLYTKAVITKDLSSTTNTTYAFKADDQSSLSYGFAISARTENVSGLFNVFLYQTKLVGAVELPRVQVTNNTNVNFTPMAYGLAVSTKTIFIYFSVADKAINATSFAIGTATRGKDCLITTNNNASIGYASGEALSASQHYTTWKETPTALKAAIVDFSAGTVATPVEIGNYNNTWTCAPYSTDKKYYGVWCQHTDNGTTSVLISSTNTTLTPLFTTNSTTQKVINNVAYGPYLSFFYLNAGALPLVLSYDNWDLEKFNYTTAPAKNTAYLSFQPSNTTISTYRIPQGGLYVLAYNTRPVANGTYSLIQVGLLTGASYLTTVFGFLLTIIAGLFLF